MKNNFLFNHLVAVRDNKRYKQDAYNQAITKNETTLFYHNAIQNNITLKHIIIELYLNITENTIEEFKSTYEITDFDKLCLLTVSMFYVDYIKFNKNPISDRIATITDFMFDYVSKFESQIYELKDINSVQAEPVKIPKEKTQNSKEKVKVMSHPDLIMFESIKECEEYYKCRISGLLETGKVSTVCGQTFRRIKR